MASWSYTLAATSHPSSGSGSTANGSSSSTEGRRSMTEAKGGRAPGGGGGGRLDGWVKRGAEADVLNAGAAAAAAASVGHSVKRPAHKKARHGDVGSKGKGKGGIRAFFAPSKA
jgi:hypothetical protein